MFVTVFAADEDVITEPAENTPYYFCVTQGDKSNTRYHYFGYVVDSAAALYLDTAKEVKQAIPMFLHKVEGGWQLFQVLDGQIEFIYLYKKGSNIALGKTTDPSAATVYTWNSEYNTLLTDFEGATYFMGVNSAVKDGEVTTKYTKIKAIKVSKLGQDHNFASYFVSVPEGVEVPEIPEIPEPTTPPETDPPATEPSETDPPATNPPETDPPKTEATEPTATEPSGSDSTPGNQLPIGAIIAVAVLLLGGVAMIILGRKKTS